MLPGDNQLSFRAKRAKDILASAQFGEDPMVERRLAKVQAVDQLWDNHNDQHVPAADTIAS